MLPEHFSRSDPTPSQKKVKRRRRRRRSCCSRHTAGKEIRAASIVRRENVNVAWHRDANQSTADVTPRRVRTQSVAFSMRSCCSSSLLPLLPHLPLIVHVYQLIFWRLIIQSHPTLNEPPQRYHFFYFANRIFNRSWLKRFCSSWWRRSRHVTFNPTPSSSFSKYWQIFQTG